MWKKNKKNTQNEKKQMYNYSDYGTLNICTASVLLSSVVKLCTYLSQQEIPL